MRWSSGTFAFALPVVAVTLAAAVTVRGTPTLKPVPGLEQAKGQAKGQAKAEGKGNSQAEMVARGRFLILTHACGECHGGGDDPAAKGWLAGATAAPPQSGPGTEFLIGPPPCGTDPKATGCFRTRPRNLTPDKETGLGQFTARQIFNALRFGLRPEDTPDVQITSMTPGKGNFPLHPHYLAPPMPWNAWRHMPDADLHAIVAYLQHGLKPVVNKVPDSEGPPDFWASFMIPENIGEYPAPKFPTENEQEPEAKLRAQALRGRALVQNHDCAASGCHMGEGPAAKGYLAGVTNAAFEFVFGGCFADQKQPCFHGRAKNLTPDPTNGIGRFTDRQLFNALRYGLRPEDTPDVLIRSRTPGKGNFPAEPHYLGPFMPWASWRYMPDSDLWAIISYLRHGLKPVSSDVALSDDLPDHWAGAVATYGAYPPPPFPTANEVKSP